MVNREKLRGIFSALITPTNPDETVNYRALGEIVRRQLDDGVEGFYCCGSSGEGLLLTIEERKKILECVIESAEGRAPVIAHIGTIRTSDVLSMARHAKQAGAAAVSMIPPYYYQFTMDEITRYYERVIEAEPDLGVIIYNIPQFTGIEFGMNNAQRLLNNPGIIGIKHTSKNLYSMERMRTAFPDKIIFNGFDEQLLGALAMGADTTIGTTVNLFAPLFLKLRDCFQQHNISEAMRLQTQINERVEMMCQFGIFNAVKFIWTLRGIDCGVCREPFQPLTDDAKQILAALWKHPMEL